MRQAVWVMIFAVAVGATPAWAARTKVHEAAESPQYGRKAGGMVGRGALNVVTCFVDPIVQVVNETKVGPPLLGTLRGVATGLGCGVLRLGSGALDLVTFWVPGFNGFAVSDSYDDCLAVSPASADFPAGYGSPTSTWEVPTAEPGAAQLPTAGQPPKKTWKK